MASEIAQTAPRDLVVTNRAIEFGNIEAWMNIVESYEQSHPGHEVVFLYEGETVHNLITFFKMDSQPNREAFQVLVSAPDANLKDVPKLYRFLVEGGSNRFERYIQKETYQVLKLF